jgi:charged multivesicular body protein 2A
MAKAMAGATKSMAAMNKRMNLPALHQIMKEFEKQNAKMDMVDEMMGDAMDDVFEVLFSFSFLSTYSSQLILINIF